MGAGYFLPPNAVLYNEIINGYETHIGKPLVPLDRAKLERQLKATYFAHPSSVSSTNLSPSEVAERRNAARMALLFPCGHRLQFDDTGNAKVILCSAAAEPRPMFFKKEINAQVSVDALKHHISGGKPVDCARLLGFLRGILGQEQAQCYVHVIARILAQQGDAKKSIIVHYGTGREVGKTLLAMLPKLLGIAAGVWTMVPKDVKKAAFIAETRDTGVVVKTLKPYQTQAVIVIDEVGAKGIEDYNRDNIPVVFKSLMDWHDASKTLQIDGFGLTVPVSNYAGIILTGNTGSPADAFRCGLDPGDATRVYPLNFGGCAEEDDGYAARAKSAKELYEACKADTAGMLLQFLALIVDFAKEPLAKNKHSWPTMPSASGPRKADPGAVVTTWCEANAGRFRDGAPFECITRRDVWAAMADCDEKRPQEAKGPACKVFSNALDAYMLKRFSVVPKKGRSDLFYYPGVVLVPAAGTNSAGSEGLRLEQAAGGAVVVELSDAAVARILATVAMGEVPAAAAMEEVVNAT